MLSEEIVGDSLNFKDLQGLKFLGLVQVYDRYQQNNSTTVGLVTFPIALRGNSSTIKIWVGTL